jgi:hypothetical protein
MKSGVTGLAIVGALLVIGGAAGLFAYQSEQMRGNEPGARATGLEIVVYKTPT